MHDLSDTVVERFWSHVAKGDGCWLWTASRNKKGYGKLGRGAQGTGWVHAHRLSWFIHYGEDPGDRCVLHRCDNTSCVRPDHLFLGSRGDNNRDMHAKGRQAPSPGTKLTTDQVKEIRYRLDVGVPVSRVARDFDVVVTTISNIRDGVSWRQ